MDRLYGDWRIIGEYLAGLPDGQAQRLRFQDVYHIVRMIPRGYVATYGQIAAMLGNIRWARMVGYALHDNPDGDFTPCYRVVNKEGRVSDAFVFGGRNRQIDLLREDGIKVSDDGYVKMPDYLWKGW
ncbi:MAG: methylated-DNA--[protein]-cysteine S-methyltransferase [Saccharofermentans sp.]|nr:methylated-DNA--[protein]-cysteine S-methyltransferase [Saccharofermentans sp.]